MGCSISTSMRYSPEILAVLGMGAEQLFPAVRPGTVIGEVTRKAAEAMGLRPGTLVVAGGGDGQASGLGTGTLGGGRAYLNIGTAAVSGVWGRQFATSHAFRTLTSLSGEGYIFELCLRTGAFLTDWSVKQPVRRRSCRRPRDLPAPGGRGRAGAARSRRRPAAALLVGHHGAVLGPGCRRCRGRPAHRPRPRPLLARDARGRGTGLRHGLRRDRGRDRRAGERAPDHRRRCASRR